MRGVPSLIPRIANALHSFPLLGPTLPIFQHPALCGIKLFIVNKELFIDSSLEGIDIALLENKYLTELQQARISNQFKVGDIFLEGLDDEAQGFVFVEAESLVIALGDNEGCGGTFVAVFEYVVDEYCSHEVCETFRPVLGAPGVLVGERKAARIDEFTAVDFLVQRNDVFLG